jgi:hypothetical protein
MHFDKEAYDCSKVFLAYLTFGGNATQVGIALNIPPEVVEVLAAKEDWPHKLKIYMAIRHDGELSETDRAISRTVTFVQAWHLRDIINRLIGHMHRLADDKTVLEWFSRRNARARHSKFDFGALLDLVRALNLVSRIITRAAIGASTATPEPEGRAGLTLREASAKTMDALDHFPGIDSVAFAKESLAKWESDHGQAGNEGGAS